VVALSQANPVWGHHRVMLVIPLSIWASSNLGVLLNRVAPDGRLRDLPPRWLARVTVGVLAATLLLGMAQRTSDLLFAGRTPDEQIDADVLAAVRANVQPGAILLTDDPHVAVITDLRVPPELAVWSFKRQAQGLVTLEMLLSVRDRHRPHAILLTRKPLPEGWEAELTQGYILVLRKAHRRLYCRENVSRLTPSP
jgi:hypothetical protein